MDEVGDLKGNLAFLNHAETVNVSFKRDKNGHLVARSARITAHKTKEVIDRRTNNKRPCMLDHLSLTLLGTDLTPPKSIRVGGYQIASDDIKDLLPQQVEGLRFLLHNPKSILAHTMGSGKTRTIIEALRVIHKDNAKQKKTTKILVICPKKITYEVWDREFKTWKMQVSCRVLTGESSNKDKNEWLNEQFDSIVITNPEFFRTVENQKYFKTVSPDIIVLDESHCVIGKDALKHLSIKEITKSAKHVYQSSGTPMRNNPKSLYHMIELLHLPNFPLTSEEFMRFFDTIEIRKRSPQEQVRRMYILRRLLEDQQLMHIISERELREYLGSRLPELVQTFVSVAMDHNSQQQIKARYFPENGKGKKENSMALHAFTECQVEKDICEAIAKKVIYENTVLKKKVAVLLWRKSWIDHIQGILIKHMKSNPKLYGIENDADFNRVKPAKLTGDTTGTELVTEKLRFNNFAWCLLAQVVIASLGISLTGASTLILTPNYNNNETQQAIKRIHRIGPENQLRKDNNAVHVMHISVDATPLNVIQRKRIATEKSFNSFFDPNLLQTEEEGEFAENITLRDFDRAEPLSQEFTTSNCPEFDGIPVVSFTQQRATFEVQVLSQNEQENAFNEFSAHRRGSNQNCAPYVVRKDATYYAISKKDESTSFQVALYEKCPELPTISFLPCDKHKIPDSAILLEEETHTGQLEIPQEYNDTTIVIRTGSKGNWSTPIVCCPQHTFLHDK